MTNVKETAERIEKGAAELAARQGALEAGRPWPLSEHFGVEPEASWGPLETLAHIAEMIPYWIGQIAIILDAEPAGPAPAFGRVQSDAVRIGLIERDRVLPLGELIRRISAEAGHAVRRLSELSDAEAERVGVHPRSGDVTVAGIAERFIAGHLEEHIRQVDEILAAAAR